MQKTIDFLIVKFSEAAAEHYAFTLRGDWETTNTYAKEISSVFKEILAYGTDGRDALACLISSPILEVAAMASLYSLRYKTELALSRLNEISLQDSLLGFEAKNAIQRWLDSSWNLE